MPSNGGFGKSVDERDAFVDDTSCLFPEHQPVDFSNRKEPRLSRIVAGHGLPFCPHRRKIAQDIVACNEIAAPVFHDGIDNINQASDPGLDAGLFVQFPQGRGPGRFARFNASTWQGPFACHRRCAAADEQDLIRLDADHARGWLRPETFNRFR